MDLGYIKSIEAVIAVILIVFILAQVKPAYEPLPKWDELTLQNAGEDVLLTLSYTNELRRLVYSANYSGLNDSIYSLLPGYIGFNLFKDGSLIIDNGKGDKMTSIVFFVAGDNSYNPSTLQMQLWYAGD